MVKRVQRKFFFIALGAMGVCVIALLAVINILQWVRTDQDMNRALTEMVETVEALRNEQRREAQREPEWRVESFVEQATVPEEPDDPDDEDDSGDGDDQETPAEAEDAQQNGMFFQGRPKGKPDGKQPWWLEDFLPEDTSAPYTQETAPSATPEETIINHYYYYYPEEDSDETVDLRYTAMNQYSGRLCVVSFGADGTTQVGMSDSNALSQEEAIALAEEMRGTASGDLDDYRYQVKTDGDATWVYFLDCSTELEARRALLVISCLVGVGGLMIMGLFVYFMSRRAIWPLKESMERQKRFITDAGHELKTPLAVIGTNMDILEMDIGKNEWVDGTKKQLTRLRKLVANLISLSRLEEMQEDLDLQTFCISETALECVDAFAGPAELAGKTLNAEITPDLSVQADVMTVGQLLTILCDNAVKYARGDIQVRLYASGRRVLFETENDWDHAIPAGELDRLFDRFYRGDAARSASSGKSGYGLGLSIAKAIAERNHALLTVEETEQGKLRFRVSFKREK